MARALAVGVAVLLAWTASDLHSDHGVLDEIAWGGVKVNGIPPLDHPGMIPASAAAWLKDRGDRLHA